MRFVRGGLAWLFLIATIVVQGPHDHRQQAPQIEAELGTCDESGAHWAGHDLVHIDGDLDTCPVCHHRSNPALLALPLTPPDLDWVGSGHNPIHPTLGSASSNLPDRCRAPPRA